MNPTFLAGPFDLQESPHLNELFIGSDVVTFGKNADIHYDFANDTYLDLIKKIPQDKKIDFLLFFTPEFHGIPYGIENSTFPAIALISDWSMNLEATLRIAPLFSYIFIDKAGFELFKKIGFKNVEYLPLVGFYPSSFQIMPDIPKIYDMTMVGNMNDNIHSKRSHYLKKLALLSNKYNIKFFTGCYGENYIRVLNTSKITFNYTIHGGMNMRCYEAMACGSLLFIEEENIEAPLFLKDKVHCVYYNDNNLESLLEYYINNEKERNQIIKNAHELVQSFTYKNQYGKVIGRIKEIGVSKLLNMSSKASLWSEEKKILAYIFHAFYSIEPARFKLIEKYIALLDQSKQYTYFLRGFLFLLFSDALTDSNKEKYLKESVGFFKQTIQLDPYFAPAYYNQGHALIKLGELRLAAKSMELAIQHGSYYADKTKEIGTLLYPILYDEWRQEKDRRIKDNFNDTTSLFLAKCLEGLGDIFTFEKRCNDACLFYEEALKCNSDSTEISNKLAETLYVLHSYAKSAEIYESILEKRPLFIDVWHKLPELFLILNEKEKFYNFCKQILLIINSFPHLAPLKEKFEELLNLSKTNY